MTGLGEPLDHLRRVSRAVEQQGTDDGGLLEGSAEAWAAEAAWSLEPRTSTSAAVRPRSAEASTAPLPAHSRTAPSTDPLAGKVESTELPCSEHVLVSSRSGVRGTAKPLLINKFLDTQSA